MPSRSILGEYLRPGFFQISDADAGQLCSLLPNRGRERKVMTEYGPAWLLRVSYPRYRRGWCWAIYGAEDGFYHKVPKGAWNNGPPNTRRRK